MIREEILFALLMKKSMENNFPIRGGVGTPEFSTSTPLGLYLVSKACWFELHIFIQSSTFQACALIIV